MRLGPTGLFGRDKSKGKSNERQEDMETEEDKEPSEGEQEEEAPDQIDVFQVSDYLRGKLEKVREEIRAEIQPGSIIPKLNEKKESLEKSIHQEKEKIAEIDKLIPKLKQKKKELQESMKRKQEEMSRIDEIEVILQRM